MCDCSVPKHQTNELSNFITHTCCEFQQLWSNVDNRCGHADYYNSLIIYALTTEINVIFTYENIFPFSFFPALLNFKLKGEENNLLEERQVLPSV